MSRSTTLALVCVALLAARAEAQPPRPPARVVVTASASADALASHLEERMRRRGLPLDLRQERAAPAALLDPAAPAPGDLLLRVWIDLDNPAEARLVFAHPTRGRFAIRRVELPRGLDEVARESIAMVVDAAVGSLVEGATLELTRAEAERVLARGAAPGQPAAGPVPAPPAAVVRPSEAAGREGLGAGVFYGVSVFAPGAIALMHGPGLALSRLSPRASIDVAAQYLFEASAGSRPLDARFRVSSARAGAALRAGCVLWACVHLGAQVGADVVWVTPLAADESRALPGDPFTVVSPMVRISTALRFGAVVGAPALMLAVDGDLLGSRYGVQRPAARADVVSPWRLRPVAALELGFR